jgi:hypothetical protein
MDADLHESFPVAVTATREEPVATLTSSAFAQKLLQDQIRKLGKLQGVV